MPPWALRGGVPPPPMVVHTELGIPEPRQVHWAMCHPRELEGPALVPAEIGVEARPVGLRAVPGPPLLPEIQGRFESGVVLRRR